ncbi:unnamed protein product [Diamesa serratosioi]
MDSLARLVSRNENAHTIQQSKNGTIDLQTPRKGLLFAFKDLTNNKASSSSAFEPLKSAKKSTPFENKSNKTSTSDSIFSFGPASPNLSNITSTSHAETTSKNGSKFTNILKNVHSIIHEDFYADPDEFNFPVNSDCACCGPNRKSCGDEMFDEFIEIMSAAPIWPVSEREIFSPTHIPEPEFVTIDSEEFPFSFPVPIPFQKYKPTFNSISHSIGSTEDEHEYDNDETSSDNSEFNNSMSEFVLNFSD